MALKVVTVRDLMRGSKEEVTIRFETEDLVRLPCHCQYDPALSKKDGNEVMVVKKVEVQNPDGSWSPYPSVTWLDGVESEEQLVTKVLVKKTNEEGFHIMVSSQGVPDGKLMCAAVEAGLYTETIDG
jgi:hypothetical protein